MPQCPHCQVPYEKASDIAAAAAASCCTPKGDTFCPQCGVRVSPLQEFCHECDAPLQGEAAPPQKLPPLKSRSSRKAAAPEKVASPPPEAPGPGAG